MALGKVASMLAAAVLASGCESLALVEARNLSYVQCENENNVVALDEQIAACDAAIKDGGRYSWELPYLYLDRSHAWSDKREYAKALADADKAVQLNPKEPVFLVGRAMANVLADHAKAAMADFEAAVTLAPDDEYGYRMRGMLMVELGAYQRAIDDFDKVIQIGKAEASDYVARGRAHSRLGNHVQARIDLSEAIRLDPGSSEAFALRGDANRELSDPDRAIKDFDEAIRLDPDNAEAFNLRSWIWNDQGRYEQAIADVDMAAKKDPSFFAYQANRCSVRLIADTDLEAGLTGCDEALRLRPRHPDVLSTRGAVLLKLGRVDAAKDDFGACVDDQLARDEAKRNKLDYAFCLYGRALATLKGGASSAADKERAQKDISEVQGIRPDVPGTFASYDLTP